jgi:phosphate transport system protein
MQHLEQELDAFKQELLQMAAKAKGAVDLAVRALTEREDRHAERVKAEDSILDRLEIDIDDKAVLLLSKAPMASQLRLIIAALRISQNLERIGDEATTIARRALELSHEPQLKPYIDIPRMAQMALGMIDDALNAFVNRDVAKAAAVVPRDKEVDELNRQLHRELTSYLVERPDTISRCLNLMVVSKCLERIADHASNIAEQTIFLHEGRDVRHPGAQHPPAATSTDRVVAHQPPVFQRGDASDLGSGGGLPGSVRE